MDDLVNIVNDGFSNYFNNMNDISNVSIEYSYAPFGNNNITQDLQLNASLIDNNNNNDDNNDDNNNNNDDDTYTDNAINHV